MVSRSFSASALVLAVTLLSTAAPAGAIGGATIVLGKMHLLPHGTGWGTADPSAIFNGGDPSGQAWNLRWSGWGSAVAQAHGLTSIFRPQGGYYAKPGAIELRASEIGHCSPDGPPAYTHLEARVAVRPGGPLSRWFVWGGWRSTCIGP